MLSIFHFAISIRADHGDRSLLGEDYRKGAEELVRAPPTGESEISSDRVRVCFYY
jgi:hypothetical protein